MLMTRNLVAKLWEIRGFGKLLIQFYGCFIIRSTFKTWNERLKLASLLHFCTNIRVQSFISYQYGQNHRNQIVHYFDMTTQWEIAFTQKMVEYAVPSLADQDLFTMNNLNMVHLG